MRATLTSIHLLTNGRTRLVHFLLLPLLNLALLVAVNNQFLGNFSWNVAAASVLMSGAMMTVTALCISFTTDRSLGIDREVVARAPFSWYYWGCKFLVAALLGAVVIAVNLALLVLAGKTQVPWRLALSLAPQMIFSGLAVGFVACVGAWSMQDPYFWNNLLTVFSNVVSGALVLLSAYPPWLRLIGKVFPFASTLSRLHGAAASPRYDLLLALAWLLLGCLLYGGQVRRLRAKAQSSAL